MTDRVSTAVEIARLDEPNALAPLMLPQEYAAKLGEGFGRVVERSEDALPVLDRQGDDDCPEPERLLENPARRLFDEPGELADVVVADRDPREHHRVEATP